MTRVSCAAPLPEGALLEYYFGELAQDDEAHVEEHLLGCAHCSQRLENLAELGFAIGSAFRGGLIKTAISPEFLEKMKQRGLRVREYRVAPGGSVHCTISATDDAVVGHLQAPLAGVTRLDALSLEEDGRLRFRLEDLPFDPAAGEVIICPSAAALRKMPAHTNHWRLLAIDEAGERVLGEYTFLHKPS